MPAYCCAAIGFIPVLGSLANALLFPIFGAGLMLGCKAQDQGGTLELAHLFAGFKHRTGDLVLVGVFNLVGWVLIAFAVAAVVGGGVFMGIMRGGLPGAGISILSMLIALLLVTGLSVPLYMAIWFAPALIVLNEVAPVAALKASFFACLNNWMPFLIYSVVLLVLGRGRRDPGRAGLPGSAAGAGRVGVYGLPRYFLRRPMTAAQPIC